MDILKIKKNKIGLLLKKLIPKYRVVGPVESDGITSFKEITSDSQRLTFNFYNTDKSPKDIIFPQVEIMFTYDGEKIQPIEYKGKPTIIFGIRPCDTKSLLLLDKVFAAEKYKDTYWMERRTNTLVFALGCNNPLPTCFCNWLDGGPFNKEGADIFLTDIGDALLVEPCSRRGEKFIVNGDAIFDEICEKATKDDLKQAEKVEDKAKSMLGKLVDLSYLKRNLDSLWDDPIWDELSHKCLGCAACTYLCPTCHCFDIQDEEIVVAGPTPAKGRRIRIWDSCMFALFTREASGHNPRPTTKERLRQRIMHKFSYFVEDFGNFACVGCGRCVRSCPVNVDIREIINTIKNAKLATSNRQ